MTYQFMLFPGFKEKALTLSYDDGRVEDVRLIEIMKKNGLKGTFNINSGRFDDPNRLNADEINKVYLESGNEVAVHGAKHYSLTSVSNERIINEIFNDRLALEKITGKIITGMAYAYGTFEDRVVEQLKACGITYSRTTISTHSFRICDDWLRLPTTCHHSDEKLFELAEEFISGKNPDNVWTIHPKLFYVWGHSYEFDMDSSWDRMEKFAEMVGNREDVWYATNGEIVRYVEAYKSLVYSADGTTVYNPSGIEVYIKTLNNKKLKISAGETVSF